VVSLVEAARTAWVYIHVQILFHLSGDQGWCGPKDALPVAWLG